MADKILVVEDEADIRKLIAYHLNQERFRVLEAENGEDALDLVHKETPRLIVLDLMLPSLSGLEFCKIIRQSAETAQTPILMLTAKAGEADRVVGLELGADDYITKPFAPGRWWPGSRPCCGGASLRFPPAWPTSTRKDP